MENAHIPKMSLVRRRKTRMIKGKLSPKTRFRSLIRQVIDNRAWLIKARDSKEVDEDVKKQVLMIDIITQEKFQSLSIENKSLLRKDAGLRTEEEIENLYRVIGNLKCFRRYPENVRKELVGSTYFEYYGPNRVIVRQNHESTFLAFVLRGELEMTFTKTDPVFGKLVTEVTSHLLPGDVFGDVSLLHGIPRTHTVTSVTAVELLILKKDDFDRVLKASMQKQWDDISSALKQFPYFDNWSEMATRECCMLSDTSSYNAQEIILGKGFGKLASAHFVLRGTCSMVQRLMVSRKGSGYKRHPSVRSSTTTGTHSTPSAATQASGTQEPAVQPLFMQVCLYDQGGCFNLGESLEERTIVADTEVKILRIPLYLLRQHNTANIWHRIRQFLESRLPSEGELFDRFLEARKWDKYKKETNKMLRNPNTLNDTTIHDSPYYWRVLHMEMCNDKPCPEAPK